MPRRETITILKFEELSECAKEKALEKHRFYEVDYGWWDRCGEGLLEPDQETMKKLELQIDQWSCPIINYKVSAFDIERGSYLQLTDIDVRDEKAFRKMLGIPLWLWEYVYYTFKNSHRETNTELVIELDLPEGEEKPEIEHYLNFLANVHFNEAKAIWDEMMENALKILRDDYYYLISDEAVAEMLTANEYEFTED